MQCGLLALYTICAYTVSLLLLLFHVVPQRFTLCSLLSLFCGVVQQLGIDSFSGEGGSVEEHNTYQAMMQVCTSSSCPSQMTLQPCAQSYNTIHMQQLTLSSLCTQEFSCSQVLLM